MVHRILNLKDGASQPLIHSDSLHLSPLLQFKYESLNSCLSWILWFVLINLFSHLPTPKILKKWVSHVVILAFVESVLLLIHLEIEQAPSAPLQPSHWVAVELLFDIDFSATLAPLLTLLAWGFSGIMISNWWSMRSQDDFDLQTTQLVFLQVGVHLRPSRSLNDVPESSKRSVMTLPVRNTIYSSTNTSPQKNTTIKH
jgi:hypothetical protein